MSILVTVPTIALAKDVSKPSTPVIQATESFQLALRYEHGEGVKRDPIRALELYCDAAGDGDPRAYFNLGWMYALGRGVMHDDGIAVSWWQKAAARGIPQAQNLLLMMRHVAPSGHLECQPPHGSRAYGRADPRIRALVRHFSERAGLDSRLVLAVISSESGFNASAISPKHAMGLMQLTADTADRFGVTDPFDPEQNIRGGTEYLRWLIQHFKGDLVLALAGYNAGEKVVERYGRVPPIMETRDYISRIRRLYPIRPRQFRHEIADHARSAIGTAR